MVKHYKKYIFPILAIFIFIVLAKVAMADDPVTMTPSVGLGEGFLANTKIVVDGDTLGNILIAVYKYGIGIIGLLATIVMMLGGLKWLSSAGDSGKIGDATKMIQASITGLALALCSYLILATVNADLVKTKTLKIDQIKAVKVNFDATAEERQMIENGEDASIGCCLTIINGGNSTSNTTKTGCNESGGTFFEKKTSNGQYCTDNKELCVDQPDGEGIIKRRGVDGYCADDTWNACKKDGAPCGGHDYECCNSPMKKCHYTTELSDSGESTERVYTCQ